MLCHQQQGTCSTSCNWECHVVQAMREEFWETQPHYGGDRGEEMKYFILVVCCTGQIGDLTIVLLQSSGTL
jgi:hypothetical protein